jgi:hypothetical protein
MTIPITFILFLVLVSSNLYAANIIVPSEHKQYVHSTIWNPIVDGINLTNFGKNQSQTLEKYGYVDISKAPFNADPTGKKDSTNAIQKCVNYARDHQLACYFPEGKYRITDTIECIQQYYRRSNGYVWGARNFPCLLVGSRKGRRPIIILSSGSKGFNDRKKPKPVILFGARGFIKTKNGKKTNPDKIVGLISMNQMMININVEVEGNNKGAIGIHHPSAQGSGIQDCLVTLQDGFIGVEGGCGAGGSFVNLKVIGGEIGIDMRHTDVTPTLVGVTLVDQMQHAILYRGMNSLTAVGLKVRYPGQHAAIKGLLAPCCPFRGPMCIVDSEIICDNYKADAAIEAQRSLYLKNVFILNIKYAVKSPSHNLQGAFKEWLHVKEYAVGTTPISAKMLPYTMPIYINGKKIKNHWEIVEKNVLPPQKLISQHLWKDDFPHFENLNTVNVKKPPYNAIGNGVQDDTRALQSAIDENEYIFIPKGYYRVVSPIRLKKNTKIIGVGRHLSIILADYSSECFNNAEKPMPIIETVDTYYSSNILNNLGFFVPRKAKGAYALLWRSGKESIIRDININNNFIKGFGTQSRAEKRSIPLFIITGNGSGKIYNTFQEQHAGQGDNYRHLLIKNAIGPLDFYQLNPEKGRGQTNVEIDGSSNISIYGLKSEGNYPVLWIKNSRDINVFGYGGIAAAFEKSALFIVENTIGLTMANVVDTPRISGGTKKTVWGYGIHPSKWHMIKYIGPDSNEMYTKPYERPVLFKCDGRYSNWKNEIN